MIMLIVGCAASWGVFGNSRHADPKLATRCSRSRHALAPGIGSYHVGVMIGWGVLERLGRRSWSVSLIALATTPLIRILVEA